MPVPTIEAFTEAEQEVSAQTGKGKDAAQPVSGANMASSRLFTNSKVGDALLGLFSTPIIIFFVWFSTIAMLRFFLWSSFFGVLVFIAIPIAAIVSIAMRYRWLGWSMLISFVLTLFSVVIAVIRVLTASRW